MPTPKTGLSLTNWFFLTSKSTKGFSEKFLILIAIVIEFSQPHSFLHKDTSHITIKLIISKSYNNIIHWLLQGKRILKSF